jgi:hypothetical protein
VAFAACLIAPATLVRDGSIPAVVPGASADIFWYPLPHEPTARPLKTLSRSAGAVAKLGDYG